MIVSRCCSRFMAGGIRDIVDRHQRTASLAALSEILNRTTDFVETVVGNPYVDSPAGPPATIAERELVHDAYANSHVGGATASLYARMMWR